MCINRTVLLSYSATSLFVLLWSSGAIFSKIGLESASPFAFLLLRFSIALTILLIISVYRRQVLPKRGTRLRVAKTGLLLIGSYSIFYILALEHEVTPGTLATLLGTQPILTLFITERQYSMKRLAGLGLALTGLTLIVYQNLGLSQLPVSGVLFALAALTAITTGSLLQKGEKQSPLAVLPLQYAMTLLLCLLFVPYQPIEITPSKQLFIALFWLAIVISIVATLLMYKLIQAGNLVNVTSLFYLVPGITAILDYLSLGNALPPLSLVGMLVILGGLTLVFKTRPLQPTE
ncbi:DMT family transporter [Nitrincola iocasae]|uniref:DMT family transporter n=1 Tax=Nitrincola iocasae TaxID=2614693 RepID=A0A5J6LAH9_9GAMM|nr:DMT family transporter [Nitrincola iocasae]QEW05386.1 DMT family transporter [Nitrincola iocasae]